MLSCQAFFVLAACVAQVGADPLQGFVLSLTDQSSYIQYFPEISGNGTASWNVSYTLSPWSSTVPNPNICGQGTSSHWTNLTDAAIVFDFVGTGFEAYGLLSGSSSVEVMNDGVAIDTQPFSSNRSLASVTGLPYYHHTVNFTRKGDGGLEFFGLDLSLGPDNAGPYTNVSVPCIAEDQNLDNSFTWYPPGWGWATTPSPSGGSGSSNSNVAYANDVGAIVSLVPPTNTSIVIIYGDVGINMCSYIVTINSDLYNSSGLAPSNQMTTKITGGPGPTLWSATNQVVWYAVIEPGHTYNISLEDSGPALNNISSYDIGLDRVVFISNGTSTSTHGSTVTLSNTPSPTQSVGGVVTELNNGNHKTILGVVLGAVLGGVAAILSVVGVWWCYHRRRRRANTAQNKIESPGAEKPFTADLYFETEELPSEVHSLSPPLDPSLESAMLPGSSPVDTQQTLSGAGDSEEKEPEGDRSSAWGDTEAATSPITNSIALQVVGTSGVSNSLDTSDPNFERKWQVFHNLGEDASISAPIPNIAQRPPQRESSRWIEVDAGRLGGGEDTLPPNYDPAWAPDR